MRFRALVLAVAVGLAGCGDADSPLHLADLSVGDDMAVARDLAVADLRAPDLAGASWVAQSVPVPTSLYAIAGVPGEIYVVGDQGVILRSSDDGAHWELQKADTIAALFGVWTDGAIAIAVGYHGTLLRSIDHGATWEPKPFGSATLLGVGGGSVLDDGGAGPLLWATGEGTVLQSDDGGQSWAPSSTPFSTSIVYGAWFSPLESYLAGGGSLFRTRDDGASWTPLGPGGRSVWATGSGQILVADTMAVQRSRDGGLTWAAVAKPVDGVAGFAAFASGEMWVASPSGIVQHYVGDFETEAPDGANLHRPLHAVWGSDPRNVFVVGDNGFIAHRQ